MNVRNGNDALSGLDEVDQVIVAALRQDGRTPFAQIAEQLNVSPGMIRLRYNRLVESGYLKVVAVTRPPNQGMATMAVIGLNVDGDKLMAAAEKIAGLEEVIYLVLVSGRFDIVLEAVCRDHSHLLQFLTEELYAIEGVRETESFLLLKIIKEIYY
jgi:Lrp/AsnC family transcriptional regulator for asnA, asnC and gidA